MMQIEKWDCLKDLTGETSKRRFMKKLCEPIVRKTIQCPLALELKYRRGVETGRIKVPSFSALMVSLLATFLDEDGPGIMEEEP